MKPADVEKLKSNLADQICDATGGPCSYLGRDMKTAHKGMNITEAEWNATVETSSRRSTRTMSAPREAGVAGTPGPMKPDIVGQ